MPRDSPTRPQVVRMTGKADRRAVGTYEWVRVLTSIDFDESPEIADSSGKPFKRPAGKSIKGVAWRVSYWGDADGTRVFLGPARIAVCCEVDYKTAKAILRTLCAYRLLTLVQRGGGITSPERESNGGEYRLTVPYDLDKIAKVRTKEEIESEIEVVKEKNRNRNTGQRHPRSSRGTDTPVTPAGSGGITGQLVPATGESRGNGRGDHGATGSAIPTQYQPGKENQPSSPLPPAAPDAPSDADTREGRKDDLDPQTQRINTLTTLIASRRPNDPRWKPDKVRKAINDCLTAGRSLDAIGRAFPLCEADPDTASPARLPLPFPWWDDEPDCERCKGQHTIVGQYATGPREIPCPKCRREPLHDEKCELHPAMPAWNCGTCRATRAAACPHPDHNGQNDTLDNCGTCWSHVKARQDPFEGFEHLRPTRWTSIYGTTLARNTRPASAPTELRPRPKPTRRPLPECGRSICRNGWYKLGVSTLRCHICPDPNEQDTLCAS